MVRASTVKVGVLLSSGENEIYNSNTYYYDAQVDAGQSPTPINDDVSLPGHPDHVPGPAGENNPDNRNRN